MPILKSLVVNDEDADVTPSEDKGEGDVIIDLSSEEDGEVIDAPSTGSMTAENGSTVDTLVTIVLQSLIAYFLLLFLVRIIKNPLRFPINLRKNDKTYAIMYIVARKGVL